MKRSRKPLSVLAIFLSVLAIGFVFNCNTAQSKKKKQAKKSPPFFRAFDHMMFEGPLSKLKGPSRVYGGDRESGATYYDQISKELAFVGNRPPATLDAILEYMGYGAITAQDFDRLEPTVLMDPAKLQRAVANQNKLKIAWQGKPLRQGEILATRFFAPKTSDVSGKVEPVKLSWRKLVRLKARPGSTAYGKGIDAMFWLSNSYMEVSEKSPYDSHIKNNQVILTKKKEASLKDSIYFFVFDSVERGGKIALYAETSWDAADPELLGDINKKYFIPDACVHCHGLSRDEGMLSYLDTDHWLDRIQPGDDFTDLLNSKWSPIFDGGKNPDSKQYRQAFEVLRQLNREILQQNQSVSPDSFFTRATQNWLRLHKDNSAHLEPIKRSIVDKENPVLWNAASETDRQLLPLLNRYCYRCHSSLLFHVFDKQAVLDRIDDMVYRIEEEDFSVAMPQDRILSAAQKQRFIKLLEALAEENQ